MVASAPCSGALPAEVGPVSQASLSTDVQVSLSTESCFSSQPCFVNFQETVTVFESSEVSSLDSGYSTDFSEPPSSCDEMPGFGRDFATVCRINMVGAESESTALVPFSSDPPMYSSDEEEEIGEKK